MIDLILRAIVRAILALRYRVRVSGVSEVAARGTKGILFLPNHPALIDPFMVLSALFVKFAPRFLADRDQLNRPFVHWMGARFGAVEIPDAAKYGEEARRQIDAAIEAGIKGLKRGENWLFYPAGRIYRSYLEDLGGNSAVERILRGAPEARVVLVRTRGLWGSIFGRAGGGQPSVAKALKKGIVSLIANGIFFSPRREVTVELIEPEDLPRAAERFTINRYLEAFYNKDARHNTYVPYTIWEKGGAREAPEPGARRTGAALAVPEAARAAVIKRLQEMTGVSWVNEENLLGRDLGLDSLARVDLAVWLEEQFGFPPADPEGLQSVGDVIEAACGQAVGSGPAILKGVARKWFKAAPLQPIEGATVAEAFLAQARRTPGKAIVADQTAGVLTYRDVVAAVTALAPEIAKLPGEYAGIMLPASVAVDLVYLAALFAGKTPVMVNWTVGSRNMKQSLDLIGVGSVITARALVKRIESQAGGFEGVSERFVYLEDVSRGIGIWRKGLAWAKSWLTWSGLAKAKVSETAVVLFTSGSESVPKAVPLTHANLLTNVRDGLAVLEFRADDRILGLFPPFHSFGVTCNMMLPLAAGLRTAYHPNPTEGAALARITKAYACTVVFGTPTFLKGIVRAAAEGELATLRLAVTGAERCPEPVYEAMKRRCPQMTVLEGYGVTECSPVVSANDFHAPKAFTIGKVVPSLEHAIVSVETGKRVARGETGVLIVRGASVFGGYLNYGGETPFVQFEGKPWYSTGDIVSEDEDGVLTFRARLKRFVKIGGEMISLPAIEAAIDPHYASEDDEGPVIAVEAAGEEERPELVLFTTKEADRETVNRQIRGAGLSGLYNIGRVIRLGEMPLLGTGKTDYRALKRMLREGGGKT